MSRGDAVTWCSHMDWRHQWCSWRHADVIIQLTKRANNDIALDHVIIVLMTTELRIKHHSQTWKLENIVNDAGISAVCVTCPGNATWMGLLWSVGVNFGPTYPMTTVDCAVNYMRCNYLQAKSFRHFQWYDTHRHNADMRRGRPVHLAIHITY